MKQKDKAQFIDILSYIITKINSSFHSDDTHNILHNILEVTISKLGFEFAAFQMLDKDQKKISTVMSLKDKTISDAVDPSHWVGASHPLNPTDNQAIDIHAWLLSEHQQLLVIEGFNEHFDKDTYEDRGGNQLIRAFVPVIARDPDMFIGTIEAGYNIKRQDRIEDEQLMMLELLANVAAIAIRNHVHMAKTLKDVETSIREKEKSIRESREKKTMLNVFLCHSSGDKPAVKDLYYRLRSEGISPWLDEEDILPGQDWDAEIQNAVRKSNIVILCLSKESVDKSGYVQKEIRYALDVADEQPERAIFIIPVRLESCSVPKKISHLQWVDLYEKGGYEQLLRALEQRALTLGLNSLEK